MRVCSVRQRLEILTPTLKFGMPHDSTGESGTLSLPEAVCQFMHPLRSRRRTALGSLMRAKTGRLF